LIYLRKTYHEKASAFIDDIGVANLTEQEINAANFLAKGVDEIIGWPQTRLCYPFEGGTSGTNSKNMENPGAKIVSWINSPVFDSTGATGNGTDTRGETGFTPSNQFSSMTNIALTCYGNVGTDDRYYGGVISVTPTSFYILSGKTNSGADVIGILSKSMQGPRTGANGNGPITITQDAVDTAIYHRGALVQTLPIGPFNIPDREIFLLSYRDITGLAVKFLDGTLKTFIAHEKVTASQVTDLHTMLDHYNDLLDRKEV